MVRQHLRVTALFVLGTFVAQAHATGASLYKSGPIQITRDGQFVWLVSPDHDSVSRLRASDNAVVQFALPDIGRLHNPRGLAINADNAQVWVAAHDSDRVYVLDAVSGAVLDTIVFDAGSGPIGVAISQDGAVALVALHRSGEVAQFDVATRTRVALIKTFHHPMGISFVTTPNRAWVTHTLGDGEDSHISLIDTALHNVASQVILKSVNPKEVAQIAGDPDPIPEGGYINLRGLAAQPPNSNLLWLPVQYQNFHNDVFTPDSTVQAALHKIDLTTNVQPATGRVVLTAVYAHNNTTLLGPGWDAGFAGPVDLAFNAAGTIAYLLGSYSNDVLVVPTNIGMTRGASPPLVEIPVGDHPQGVVASPTAERAYVMNYLSRDVSVIDLATNAEIARVAATPGTTEPLAADFLLGAKLFNSSADARLSNNGKVACASCHPHGETDGLSWALDPLGAGTRKTLPMRGVYLAFGPQTGGRGQLHRSGDRDEVQDFDLTARGVLMGGTGFLATPNPALGPPNAGRDADLDALASYVLGLEPQEYSPHRAADGGLPEAAIRGAAIFNRTGTGGLSVGCRTCHPAPNFSNLGFHNIGGFAPQPENEGPNFNTPTLVGAWDNPVFVQATGGHGDSGTLGGVVRDATGNHGNTTGLNRSLKRDLEAFLNCIDGALAAGGPTWPSDQTPPRVRAVLPVSLNTVEVTFSEALDSATANNPANYRLHNGVRNFFPTAAALNTNEGNRVRLTVALEYPGCDVTYTLHPGPIQDMAGAIAGGPNNPLDVNDASNRRSFTLDGTITVTFGGTGDETLPDVTRDAGIIAGLTNWSHARWHLYPATSPEMKGFVRFDFIAPLIAQCGVTNSAQILDARFSVVPNLGHRNTVELRRCLMPWNEPPNDWCAGCSGAVTVSHSTYPTVAWHTSGARSIGGSGTSPSEYHPTGTRDLAATIDATAQVSGIGQRVEFAGPLVTDAFRFWFDHPSINFGYGVEAPGATGPGTEFHNTTADDGRESTILAITFATPQSPNLPDCNANGAADTCDILSSVSQDVNGNGVPDECECVGDLNADGQVGLPDLTILLSNFGRAGGATPDEGDLDGDADVDLGDLTVLLSRFGATCP